MYLFARRRRVNPARAREAIATGVELGNRAGQITGLPVSTWLTVWSADANTVVWSSPVERLEDLDTAFAKLMADDGFNEAAEGADALFTGPVEDVVRQVLNPPPPSRTLPALVYLTTAEAAPGRLGEATTAGVEVATTITAAIGAHVAFAVNVTGPYAGVAWITGEPDAASFERARSTLLANQEVAALIDRAGPLFVPGATARMLRRLS